MWSQPPRIYLRLGLLFFALAASSLGQAMPDRPNGHYRYHAPTKFTVNIAKVSPEEELLRTQLQQEPLQLFFTKRDPQKPYLTTCQALEHYLGISYRNRYLREKNVLLDFGNYHILSIPFGDEFNTQHLLAIYDGEKLAKLENALIVLSFDLDYNFITGVTFNEARLADVSELVTYGQGQDIELFKFLAKTFKFGGQATAGGHIYLASFLPAHAEGADVILQQGPLSVFYTPASAGQKSPRLTLRWQHPASGRLEDLFTLEFSPQGQLISLRRESFNFAPSFFAAALHMLTQVEPAFGLVGEVLGLSYLPELFTTWNAAAPLSLAKRSFVRYWQEHPPVFLHPLSHALNGQEKAKLQALLGQNIVALLGLDETDYAAKVQQAIVLKKNIFLQSFKKNITIEYRPSREVYEREDIYTERDLTLGGHILINKRGIQFDQIYFYLTPDQRTIHNVYYKKQNSPAILKRLLNKSTPEALQKLAQTFAEIVYQTNDPAQIEILTAAAETSYAPTCTIQRAISDYYGDEENERFVRQVTALTSKTNSAMPLEEIAARKNKCATNLKRPNRANRANHYPSPRSQGRFRTNSFDDLGLKF